MAEDKQDQIWDKIKQRAKEIIGDGEMDLTLKVHQGNITGGEVKQERIKLG